MAALTELFHWGSWTWRSAEVVDREIEEEFDFHIDCRIRELIDSGMTPELAAEEAGRLFGPAMSGVICVRARKEAFPAIPRRKREERYVRVPGLSTATARG